MYKSITLRVVGEKPNWIYFGIEKGSSNEVNEAEMNRLFKWLASESMSIVIKCKEEDMALNKSTILFSRLEKI